MPQTTNLAVKGLFTYASALSGVPQGALSVADEINISRLNIIEPRRGFAKLTYSLPTSTDRANKWMFFSGEALLHYNSATLGLYDESSGVLSRGALIKPTNAQTVRHQPMNESLFITSSTGLMKMDDTAEDIYAAGIPRGLMITTNGALVVTGTAVEAYGTVAYRYILGRKDANSKTVYGGASSRVEVTAAATFANVPLRVYLPSGLDDTYFAQVYRTKNASGTVGNPTAASDEMQLCYEVPLTSAIVSTGYFDFTDIQPDDLLGATLYTSPSMDGIKGNNEIPPLASDIEEYKNYLFFADTISKHKYAFTLIACGGAGLLVNDTITISDGVTTEVYTAKAAENIANKQFIVDVASASLSVRIDTTIRSFINVVNRGSALVYAQLLSTGGTDLPGKVLLEERSLGGTAFTVVSARAAAWSPQLQATADRNQTSLNDEYKNGLMYSKNGQSEAVPTANVLFVGSADDRIKRIVALQDGLFIFKEEDGIYVLRGESPGTFSVQPLDMTAKILAPETLTVLNNMIYGLFYSGVGAVSDSGVEFISEPIKDKIQSLIALDLDTVKTVSFGIGYEDDGKYILALPTVADETVSTQQYVYDVFGDTWCRWLLNTKTAAVNPVDKIIYLAPGDSSALKFEKKTYSSDDFSDYMSLLTITAYTTTSVTLSDTANIEVGDILEQGSLIAYVESIDHNTSTVVIDTEQAWVLNTADVAHEASIKVAVQWNHDFADNPAGQKLFYETNLLFKQGFQRTATVYFYSDVNPSEASIEIDSPGGNGAFGEFTFGEEVFGGDLVDLPVRLGVPRAHRRCNLLTVRFEHQVAYSDFMLNGLAMSFNPISQRTSKGRRE